ncbi:MAG TPA: hypothetical protein VED01_15170 [Burkholderiales bacterium]|nr:hypothetical protein [Burkholderiales bacterium]
MIELVSPIGHPRVEPQAELKALGDPVGKRAAFIWNQYQTTRNFWPRLEREVEAVLKPSRIERAYKGNTWMPLERERFSELAASVDYFVVGVGA